MKKAKKTNATKAEIKKVTKLYFAAQNTPCIAITSSQALEGRDFAATAWDVVYDTIETLALKHGYMKRKKRYGLNCETGEFI